MERYRLSAGLCLALWAASAPVAAQAQSSEAAPAATASRVSDVTEVIVTARRRDERLQDVPVSIVALTNERLSSATVQHLSDITSITPGLNFGSEGGKDQNSVSLRGIGQIPLGEGTPAVVTYVNDVAIPSKGSNLPTFDIASIQVLKGPQGTLFGRNTLGGAIVVTTTVPTFEFGGYVQGTYGNYDRKELEAAVNIPLVADKAALRVAGQIVRRDGVYNNLSGGKDFGNLHDDSARISLLLTPINDFKTLTVADYTRSDDTASPYLVRQNFSFSALFVPSLGPVAGNLFGASLDSQIQAQLRARGPFDGYADGTANQSYRRSQSVTNDTSYAFGNLTARNIFGYRRSEVYTRLNILGNGSLFLPSRALGAPADTPFTLFDAESSSKRKYLTDEVQLLGDFDRLDFIVGAFFNKDQSTGPSGSRFAAFATPGPVQPGVTAHVRNKNTAVFAQFGFDITDKLKLNVGGRYSWDRISACGGAFGLTYVDESTCRARAALNLIDGVGVLSAKGSAPSWTLGLDYKPNSDLLLYVVTRRGYRGVGLNTPAFESQFTTGGVGCGFGRCPDLRPYQQSKEETLTDIEFGEKFQTMVSGMRVRLNTAVFYAKYKNALQFVNVQTLGLPASTPDAPTNGSLGLNIADFTNYGVELEASISPSEDFTLTFNGAYTHQKIDDVFLPTTLGVAFPKAFITLPAPKFAGTISASWTLPVRPLDGALVLNGDVFRTAAFSGQYGQNLPGYTLANARLDWRDIAGSGLDVGFWIKNLANNQYIASPIALLPTLPVSSAFLGEPRTYGVTLRRAF